MTSSIDQDDHGSRSNVQKARCHTITFHISHHSKRSVQAILTYGGQTQKKTDAADFFSSTNSRNSSLHSVSLRYTAFHSEFNDGYFAAKFFVISRHHNILATVEHFPTCVFLWRSESTSGRNWFKSIIIAFLLRR